MPLPFIGGKGFVVMLFRTYALTVVLKHPW